MRENGEISKTSSRVTGERQPEKTFSRTSGVNVFEESDDLVVPTKRANNVGQPATAESVQGRRSREGTVLHADHVSDTVPESTGRLAAGPRSASPSSREGASDPSEELYEVILHVRICAGGYP